MAQSTDVTVVGAPLNGQVSENDAESALDILPKEMWEEVFLRVKEPQDWLNLYRTCSTFQNLMESERQIALLPAVLDKIQEYLTVDDLLVARLVCRKWRDAVDNLIECLLITKNISKPHYCGPIFKGKLFSRSDQIENFLTAMNTSPQNPFIGRTVRLIYWEIGDALATTYWSSATKLLKRFGKHVQNLTLETNCDNKNNTFQTAPQLSSYLKLVPNLKALSVELIIGHPSYVYEVRFPHCIENEVPELWQLESLTLSASGSSQITSDLVNVIWKMCRDPENVTHLSINSLEEVQPTWFPNVEHLEGDFDENDLTVNLKETGWPLKTLSSHEELNLDFANVFNSIDVFGKTLTKLVLNSFVFVLDDEEVRIQLPCLKQLEIEAVISHSLDFLVGLSSLEKLSLTWEKTAWEGDPVIYVDGIEHDMYKSNIWEVLPKLKFFRFGTWEDGEIVSRLNTYRKQGYEVHLQSLSSLSLTGTYEVIK